MVKTWKGLQVTLEAQARAIQSKVQKNLNFAIARGIANMARFAAQKMQQQLPAIFDRPVRDVQAQYLDAAGQGGLRPPTPAARSTSWWASA